MHPVRNTLIAAATLIAALPAVASATNFKVEITNLTNANYFTPILVAAHKQDLDMFELGEPASAALQAIAEGGDVSGMQTALDDAGAETGVAETPGPTPLLAPGETAVALLDVRGRNRWVSLAAMILPTNDAFIGLDAERLRLREQTFYLYAYDAGTEVNDELMNPGAGGAPGVAGIPGDPSGLAGTGGSGQTTVETNTTVHVHRGILGDDDPLGGLSDLDRSAHRWGTPVAMVTIQKVFRNYGNN